MKQGITIDCGYHWHDRNILTVKKRRGKLSLAEIEDALRYSEGQLYCGHYAILLNCSEATIGGNGCFDDEPQGDAADLYPVEEGEFCPVCGKLTPPFNYCPTCGTSWKDCNKDVEILLKGMKEETERMIQTGGRHDSKVAWYWSHIGAIDMAFQLGFITDERRRELYKEVEHLKQDTSERRTEHGGIE